MSRYYITAWRHGPTGNLEQVLGNLDGQAAIRAKLPKRTKAWKRLLTQPRERLSLDGRVVCYRLDNADGRTLCEVWPWTDR